MAVNVLIGIGGTGSRVVEAAVHLCAAGLGPDAMTVAFVEPDKTNGNLQRATGTLADYQAAHAATRAEPARLPSSCRLLRTRIDVPASGETWSPVPEGTRNTRQLFAYASMSDQAKALFDVLYSRPRGEEDEKESEQTMPLDRGFSGRPAVGSAVLAAKAHPEKDDFWRHLIELGNRAEAGETVRIFLVGSIFGGSGASGFPALAQLIRRRLGEISDARVSISGALMLPYFAFTPPRGEGAAIAARSEQFLEMSQAAMEFYHRKLRDEPNLIRPLYLVGWPRMMMMEKSETGGEGQINPPLPPELFAGLAAMRHFAGGADRPEARLVTIGVGDGRLGWADVPPVARHLVPREALGALTRFAVAWQHVYSGCLEAGRAKKYRRQVWYRRLIRDAGVDPAATPTRDAHRALGQFVERYLRWIGSLTSGVLEDADRLYLFDDRVFCRDQRGGDACVLLRDDFTDIDRKRFAGLVRGAAPRPLAEILRRLTDDRLPGGAAGFGVFAAALHAAAMDDTATPEQTQGEDHDDDDVAGIDRAA